ncbi:YadA family autotransporter adhesin, partial [Burkholderia cenocepacia]
NENLGSLKDSLTEGGLIDPTTGKSLAVVYDSVAKDAVTLGGGEKGTTLTNLTAGKVSADSKDAVNGSQLYGTVQSIADTIGGGTTVDADGKLADTTIEVNGYKYKTVSEAVQAAAAYGGTDSLAVRYDLNNDMTPNYGSVTLGGSGTAPVRLTNVAAAVLSSASTDAVNGSQLFDTNEKLSDLEDRLGGIGDRVSELAQNSGNPGNPGTGSNPYFGATDKDVGGWTPANPGNGMGNTAAGSGSTVKDGVNNGTAIGSGSNVGGNGGTAIGSGSNAKAENSTAIGHGSVASGSNSVAIGAGSKAIESNTVSFGDGTPEGNRRIVNIADGVNAGDAATKGQLDRAIGGMQGQIDDVSKNAYSGIAAATALTMIPGVDPGKTLSFGIGGATYKGYQAVAFGGEARITQNLKMKAGVGLSSGGNTVGVGASYQW